MRKHTRRKVYTLVNPILYAMQGAAITPKDLLDKLRLRELAAIEAFRTGNATKQEWRDVSDFLNISETLALGGIGPEALAASQAAQDSLQAAHVRYQEGEALTLTEPELQTLRDGYEYFDLQRQSISRAQFEQAIKRTSDRIRSAHPSVKVCVA